jgi:hypothetical protein
MSRCATATDRIAPYNETCITICFLSTAGVSLLSANAFAAKIGIPVNWLYVQIRKNDC